jgi:hypothetical protein
MSSWLMPLARYSSTSATVMRVPARQGLPLRTPGVHVISGADAEFMGGGEEAGDALIAMAAF